MRRGTGKTDEAVYAPSLDIDTAVLRLCGKAYDESLPTLYENSKYNFHSPDTINCFRVEDLLLVHSTIDERQVLPVFFAQPSCYGRVSMIRNWHFTLLGAMTTRRKLLSLIAVMRTMYQRGTGHHSSKPPSTETETISSHFQPWKS